MAKRKIVVKTYTNGDIKPLHFCIIDSDLAHQHMQKYDLNYDTFLPHVEKWASQDFRISLHSHDMNTVKAFKRELEQAIKEQNPNLPAEMLSCNLINGWISTHMRKELQDHEYGKPSI